MGHTTAAEQPGREQITGETSVEKETEPLCQTYCPRCNNGMDALRIMCKGFQPGRDDRYSVVSQCHVCV